MPQLTKYYIGIDGGVNTGFAVWNSTTKRFRELDTYSFWEAIDRIDHYINELRDNKILLEVVIEDVTQNKPTFNRGAHNQSVYNKMSQNVGANKRDCTLISEYCELNEVPIHKIRPTKASLTKLDSETFKKITGYEGRSSSHARDAGCLVFGRQQ